MISFSQFESNLLALNERLQKACAACGRNFGDVKILPVTKNHPIDALLYAQRAGFKRVGENKVQEAMQKFSNFDGACTCELIGHLQSNKVKKAVQIFSRIQSVDSFELAKKINLEAQNLSKIMPVLLQINAGADPAKFGASLDESKKFFESVLPLANLKIEGLMTIAPLDENLEVAKAAFGNLRNLKAALESEFNIALSELSMGMSDDLEAAVAEGSTQIRVGTALFGARDYGR